MESFIIIFLALLWACFATDETDRNLRGLKKDTVEICVNLHKYGHGHHTLEVPVEKRRWFHKWNDVKLGPCKAEDYVDKKSDERIETWCRLFGGSTWCEMHVPRMFGEWVEDHGGIPGECRMKNQGDVIDVRYVDNGVNDDDDDDDDFVDDILCMDVEEYGEYHTVEVTYDYDISFFRNFFRDIAHRNNECRSWEEDFDETNDHPRRYCVDIDGRICDVETDSFFKEWWEDNSDEFWNRRCNSVNNLFEDDCLLTMHHT